MSVANVRSKWASGNLVFTESVAGNDAAIHFGVDDTGLDVKFFGATSGSYMLWDQSDDKLIINAGTVDLGTLCEADAYTVGGVAGLDVSGDGTIASFTMTAVKGIITAFAKVS